MDPGDNSQLTDWARRLDERAGRGEATYFLVDFERQMPRLWSPEAAAAEGIRFSFPGSPDISPTADATEVALIARPLDPAVYARAFEIVQAGLRRGDSYLTNLTFPTPVILRGSLQGVYSVSRAKYRVWWPERFVCFSPETFVTIDSDGYIETRPMKGTAANTPAGLDELRNSPKEMAEHATIVDLMRNDLSRVAREVRVTDYRYVRPIETGSGGLLQSSSKIGGRLPEGWRCRLGSILRDLLPAGSVSGAPKPATVELIRRAESGPRGYYCGVAGYFDGRSLDSCVLIRFIEHDGKGYLFRSGGGITSRSLVHEEYHELNAKIRIPLG